MTIIVSCLSYLRFVNRILSDYFLSRPYVIIIYLPHVNKRYYAILTNSLPLVLWRIFHKACKIFFLFFLWDDCNGQCFFTCYITFFFLIIRKFCTSEFLGRKFVACLINFEAGRDQPSLFDAPVTPFARKELGVLRGPSNLLGETLSNLALMYISICIYMW